MNYRKCCCRRQPNLKIKVERYTQAEQVCEFLTSSALHLSTIFICKILDVAFATPAVLQMKIVEI